jgi:hypothetical protein
MKTLLDRSARAEAQGAISGQPLANFRLIGQKSTKIIHIW